MSMKVLDKMSGQGFLPRGLSSSVLPSEEGRSAIIQGTDFEFLVHLGFLFTGQLSLHIIFRTLKMAATGTQSIQNRRKREPRGRGIPSLVNTSYLLWVWPLIPGQK